MKNVMIVLLFLVSGSIAAGQDVSELPAAHLLPASALPAYESEIDHAGLIGKWNKGTFKLGQEVYQQVCQACHGDIGIAGSLPNAMRFGAGEFQNAGDPYAMYETITRGWRQMAPQVMLAPREKYAVIQYIRDHFIAKHNRGQLFKVTDDYLEGLPKGDSDGPVPVKREPWSDMDYGPFLVGTFEIADAGDRDNPWPKGEQPDYVAPDANIAFKGIGIRLDEDDQGGRAGGISKGRAWVAFEHDTLRVAGGWLGEGFIDWHGINFDGRHVQRPRTIGNLVFETSDVPGWANPATGKFEDERGVRIDGRRYGPLPRAWGQFKGIYRHGTKTVVSYTVGKADVLENFSIEGLNVVRILNVGKSDKDLIVRLSNARGNSLSGSEISLMGGQGVVVGESEGFAIAKIPAGATPVNFAIIYQPSISSTTATSNAFNAGSLDLGRLTKGGPGLPMPEALEAPIVRGAQAGAFQWDSFTMPLQNPWKSRMRLSGFDFTADGKTAIVSCWDGDVWRVDGVGDESAEVTKWTRIATGLFQPLGVKLVKGDVFITCRDQIVRLHDLNGDGQTDFYESFNSDHQVTEHFHEFAMGLQSDDEGNLYYAKSACHARTPQVPHHGTLLKVSADGETTEILAKGFRAANGVCRNEDGTFFVTDQQGHWNPMNRINWIEPGGKYYGNAWGYGAPADLSDAAMVPPMSWVDMAMDRSPSELLWVESESWGGLNGVLLNISYGYGKLYVVPHEKVAVERNGENVTLMQGALARLPIPEFATGTMRGRFHEGNGHLYMCGLSAWATSQMAMPGGFYRIRATGEPVHLPVDWHARKGGVDITFSDAIDPKSVDVKNMGVKTWTIERSANYGSKKYDEKELAVTGARLSADGKVLSLTIPKIEPVRQMSIRYEFDGANGEAVDGELLCTIHGLAASVNE